ncbi:MAG TPA: bifunctional anthranilate synthase component I family protein/class IV aminotransferase [Anaerolineae bacterium]|nr:bifunctional anthranilate synthase component I family protein/class IV aminotransferase [Anaerolineae bacterium]
MVIMQVGERWWQWRDLVTIKQTSEPDEVVGLLAEVERAVMVEGLEAAGFISYEAARGWGWPTHEGGEMPLMWFGLYRRREAIERPVRLGGDRVVVGEWESGVGREAYEGAIREIKERIAAGETYQVNYTLPFRSEAQGEPWVWFQQVWWGSRPAYSAYIETDEWAICSWSPELFFRVEGERVVTKPMKGTVGRGVTVAEDEKQRAWLVSSEKNRAENVMIVDMLRNDLGQVARTGSVRVTELFTTERYPTLWQMTSTVEAETGVTLAALLAALFPCASITGAPKRRTMAIIKGLEREARGVYTGGIGFMSGGGGEREAHFNVAIRTGVWRKVGVGRGVVRYDVGGGIVWDSEAAGEYEEAKLKGAIVGRAAAPFVLLEAVLWVPGYGFVLLAEHRARLLGSAEYFGYAVDWGVVMAGMEGAVRGKVWAQKVRVTVGVTGEVGVVAEGVGMGGPMRAAVAREPIARENRFLYHKTSRREMYTAARAGRPGYDEVILWNELGEVTEGTTANVVVRRGGRWVTPPVECGLLAGTLRGWLLARGMIEEGVVRVDELGDCEGVYLVNSVRGWREAEGIVGA